eukprot:CAMPEP_0173449754 /NCGR_PEP_ID=MMETSP1357-20121228/43324_1 /TAXON_ID=77926 /ORGANISM="Hemiselmis rufescens, Strain PCC563" /LENGTH=640 /DNA_ID=CAMNT_0014416367 /DNA_START=27 /DNA_END=1945 /DNA_ORIENTATION=-
MGNANGRDAGGRPGSKESTAYSSSSSGRTGSHHGELPSEDGSGKGTNAKSSERPPAKNASRPVSLPAPTPASVVPIPSPAAGSGGRAAVPYKRPKGTVEDDSSEDEGNGEAAQVEELAGAQGGGKVGLADFEPLKVIGNGCFGKVMMVRYAKNGKIFAMKSIRKAHVVKNKKVRHTQTERNIMQMLNHPYVMKLHYSFQNSGKLYMVMDYLNGGDIFYHLSVSRRFSEERTRFYAAEVVLALECLHQNNLVYRDLKPENVLTDAEGHIRLTDFGLSKEDFKEDSLMNTFVGTTEYLAPEVLKQKGYGKEVDWWSLGVLLFEMLTGCPPFYSKNRQMTFRMILSAELNVPEWLSQHSRQIIRELLVRDPSQRLGAGKRDSQDIRGHIFFAPIDFDALMRKEISPPYTPPPLATDDTSHFDSRFTAKVAEDSPTQSPEEPTAFEGFSYQSPSYKGLPAHDPSSHSSPGSGREASLPDRESGFRVGSVKSHGVGSLGKGPSSMGGSVGSGGGMASSLGKSLGSVKEGKALSSAASALPRINSGEFFSEEKADSDTVWVPQMPPQTEEDHHDDEEPDAGFEKLGTSLIQSSLADKSPRWRQHDSQRAASKDDSSSSDEELPSEEVKEATEASAAKPNEGGLQFG